MCIRDSFGTVHRAHASTEGVAHYLPAVCGFLIEKELSALMERRRSRGMVGAAIRVMIVGIPNVGKSTFVNRIAQADEAIVHEMRGVTRDRSYHEADWNGVEFMLIDTGGIEMGGDDAFQGSIRAQAFEGAREADVIIFLVDGKAGINTDDEEVARILQKAGKPVFVAVNKMDNPARMDEVWEFYALGLGDPWPVSAQHGNGTGDLLDEVVNELRKVEVVPEEEVDAINVAIIGRPNAGKSSLTNKLTNNNRSIVSDVAGTTRDAIHSRYNKYGLDFYLVDTAGMRKKGKVTEDLEFYSVMRSIRAIEESDVCILMLDAQQGLESQDLNIHNLIVRNRKGCVIVVNKWDLVEKGNNTMKEWKEALAKKLAPFNDIPIIFTSVLNKQRILEVLQTAIRVYENRKRRVATSALNDYLLPIIENYPPPATKGKYIKIKYVMQLPTPTPQFACFVNLPQYIKDPYRRFLENKIREEWDFSGVPIQIYFRQK